MSSTWSKMFQKYTVKLTFLSFHEEVFSQLLAIYGPKQSLYYSDVMICKFEKVSSTVCY